MSLEIVSVTAASETEKRLALLQETVGRTLSGGATWNTIQLTVRLSTDRASAWTSPPRFYFGLCSGTAAMPGSATPAHFWGIRSTSANWTWDGTNNVIGYDIESCLIQNGVVTTSTLWNTPTMNSGTPVIMNSASGHSIIALYISRPSAGNLRLQPFQSGSQTPANFNIGAAEYALISDDILGTFSNAAYSLGYRGRIDAASSDGTYGSLNTMCFGWVGSTDAFELSDFTYKVVN